MINFKTFQRTTILKFNKIIKKNKIKNCLCIICIHTHINTLKKICILKKKKIYIYIYINTTAHPWCDGHSTNTSACGVWG